MIVRACPLSNSVANVECRAPTFCWWLMGVSSSNCLNTFREMTFRVTYREVISQMLLVMK